MKITGLKTNTKNIFSSHITHLFLYLIFISTGGENSPAVMFGNLRQTEKVLKKSRLFSLSVLLLNIKAGHTE